MIYFPAQSVLHRLHPVVKLAWLLWGTVAVFVFDSVVLPVAVVGAVVILLWLVGIAPWRIPGMRLWLPLGGVILITHALSVSGGDPLCGPVSTGGVISGVRAMSRLLAVILMSVAFVATTEPVSLAYALIRLGLPYRWGFALVTALRLAPVFRVEANHVYRAQLLRGVGYDVGGPRRWWLLLRCLCLPLLVTAMRTAHSLSLSMEGRGFGLHRQRTYVREVHVTRRDVFLAAALALSVFAAIEYGLRGS